MRLTPASTTPGCRWSVRCTRAWQAAHVIPETGIRIVRSPGTGGAGEDTAGDPASSMTESCRATTGLLPARARRARGEEEVPIHPPDRRDAAGDDQPIRARHEQSS